MEKLLKILLQSRDHQRSRESGSIEVVPVHNCKGIFCVALMAEKQRRPTDVESRRRKLRLSSATTNTVAIFQQYYHSMATSDYHRA